MIGRRPAVVGWSAGLVAAAVIGIGLGTPALGIDEATTVLISTWPWPELRAAITGQEVTLAPYYLAMRPWLAVSGAEWWLRLPSLLGMAAAIGLLAGWLARRAGLGAALATTAVLLSLPSITRFGQEGRPYGLTVLLVVACSIVWWRLLDASSDPASGSDRGPSDRRPGIRYAAIVLVLGAVQLLALSVVLAQLVAAAGPARGRRPGALRRTATWAGLGVLPLLPFAWYSFGHAIGNLGHQDPTVHNIWAYLAGSFSGEPREAPLADHVAWVVLALAALSVVRLRDPRLRPLLGYAWLWALAPITVCAALAPWRPTLVARYLLAGVPAWGILAGQGCLSLAALLSDLWRVFGARTRVLTPKTYQRLVRTGVGVVVPVGVLLGVAWPRQLVYRESDGHPFGDVRPVVAMLESPRYRDLPVVVLPDAWYSVQALSYDPRLADRTAFTDGLRVADTGRLVLTNLPGDLRAQVRRQARAGVLAVLATGDQQTARDEAAAWADRAGLQVSAVITLSGWSLAELTPGP